VKAIKAQFEGGQIKLSEPAPDAGPVEVLVVFPEPADDPWEAILGDPVPRPELLKAAAEIRAEIAAGQSRPLKSGDL
jgi:hypothetical protein